MSFVVLRDASRFRSFDFYIKVKAATALAALVTIYKYLTG